MRQRHGAAPKKRSAKKKVGKKKTTVMKAAKPAKKRAAKKVSKKRTSKKKTSKKKARKSVKVTEPEGLFTQARVDSFIAKINDCYMQYEAAPLCKVSVKTVQRWLSRGRARRDERESWLCRYDERAENEETLAHIVDELGECPVPDQWSEFAEAYEEAEVLAKDKMMGTVRRGAESDPDLAQWWLERRYPTDFGRAAMRPGIGINAGSAYDGENLASGDEVAELADAIAAFEKRASATADPKSIRAAEVPTAPT